MTDSTYVRFTPPHPLTDYEGMPGFEAGGTALGMRGLDDLLHLKLTGEERTVVIGQYRYPDGRFYLDFGAPTSFIESHTDYAYDPGSKKLRLSCRECSYADGKHSRSCSRR